MVQTALPIEDERSGMIADAAADYLELVSHAAPRSVTHDTLVSLTVDASRMRAASPLEILNELPLTDEKMVWCYNHINRIYSHKNDS